MSASHVIKRHVGRLGLAFVLLVALSSASLAGTYTFQPDSPNDGDSNPHDLWDLEHGHYYTWGIDWDIPEGETIVAATLMFDDIRNWTNEDNDLWVHLLDNAMIGARQYSDTTSGDQFAGQGVELVHLEDLGTTASDITYDFTADELAALSDYLADGVVGFGFDPDCHFYNNGITLTIETATVPVPGAMLLGSLGLGVSGYFVKRRKKAVEAN